MDRITKYEEFHTLSSFNLVSLLLAVLTDIDVFLAISFISILGFDRRHLIILRSVSESSCLLLVIDDGSDDSLLGNMTRTLAGLSES
jgi:hypothetical protein